MARHRTSQLTKPAARRTSLRKAEAIASDDAMPRTPAERRTPDTDWFKRKIRASGLEQRALAEKIGKDHTAFSRMVTGKRPWSLSDIVVVANEMGWPVEDLIRHAGYPELQSRGLSIKGKITADAKVSTVTPRKGETTVAVSTGFPRGAVAYIGDMEGSALAAYHGAEFIAPGDPANGKVETALGRLAIVEADDHLTPLLGVIGKGSHRQTVNLTLFGTGEVLPLKAVHRATVVLAIVFA